jgi:hypothetical protein
MRRPPPPKPEQRLLVEWHFALSRARTHEALLRLCNEFLASWTAEEWSHLPPDCRPRTFSRMADIESTLEAVIQAFGRRRPEETASAHAVGEMLAFLFSANDRAMEIDGAVPKVVPRPQRERAGS